MAIRIRHGDVGTVAALAQKAGVAKALQKELDVRLQREAMESATERVKIAQAGAYARQMASLKAAAEGRAAATQQAYGLEQMRQAGRISELDYRNQLAIETEQREREAKREALRTWTPYQQQMRNELQVDMQKIMGSDDLTLDEKEYAINEIQGVLNGMQKLAEGPPLPEDILDQRLIERNGRTYLLDSKGNFKDVTPEDFTFKDASTFLRSARDQLKMEQEEGEPTEQDILNRATQLYRMSKEFQQQISGFQTGKEITGEGQKVQAPTIDPEWQKLVSHVKENQAQFIADMYLQLNKKQIDDLKQILATGDDQLIFEVLSTPEIQAVLNMTE